MIDKEKVGLVKEIISKKNKIAITGHVNPDGDAIGSCLALYHFFKKLDFEVKICVPNKIPKFLKWLPDAKKIINHEYIKNTAESVLKHADIIFCVDYNSVERTADMQHAISNSKATKILIDHHPEPQDFVDFTFSDTKISSAAELCYYFIKEYQPNLFDKSIAECLFTGIITDTGMFEYSSATAETLKVASFLMSFGIDKQEILNQIYHNFSVDRMRLMGYVLNEKMIILPEKKTAYISLTKEEFKKYNYVVGDHENFVNLPLSINNIYVSALFLEIDNSIRISLRSQGDYDVNKIARKYFSGGGHKNAAGGYSKLTMKETLKNFEEIIKKEL